ncbi:hypothetical protein DFH06DRAFT_1159158 [Mycena polygramma]|nr:hypothetical protein DFH06DRAFT_1159158 [Mycena polygramma]
MSTAPKFSFSTTAEEVATVFAEEIKGKNVLITGTSLNGIGFEVARVVAKYANLVVITGYNTARLKLSEEAIKAEVPAANIMGLTLNLASLAGVREAAARINVLPVPLHVLIHNAAAAMGPFKLTADGLESQLATGHVGPFLLTKLLLPKLRSAATETSTPRVVFVAGGAHHFCKGVDFAMLTKPDAAAYQGVDVGFQVKTANILTASELALRSRGQINAYSLHPGVIYTNILQKEESIANLQAAGVLGPDGLPDKSKVSWKTIPQGAATTVVAAFDPSLDATPGAYLNDCAVATETVATHAADPATAARLWSATEEIIGEEFSF